MKKGDFTELAKQYINRPNYSLLALRLLMKHVGAENTKDFRVADVGAGTGKLTENLLELGLNVQAVEPNDNMRAEGERCTAKWDIPWRAGSAEQTGLETASVNWVLMGSSFHWTDKSRSLPEFRRILKPGGFFTAVWVPRDLERSELHMRIENRINSFLPGSERVSSGAAKYTKNMFGDLISTGDFKDVVFVEADHEVKMSKERYLGVWRSVNDIQAEAGPQKWEQIMAAIEQEISSLDEIVVPYKTRAWTARRN